MHVVLVNWRRGENNPFQLFNSHLAGKFRECGDRVTIVDLDDRILVNLVDAAQSGVDFAVTWQGLGSTLRRAGEDAVIWEDLRIPLVCLHGDHPCHNPANHDGRSKFVRHNYHSPSFLEYANRYIPRSHPASYFQLPNFFTDEGVGAFEGRFFVLPKNLDDPREMLDAWQRRYPPVLSDFLGDTFALIAAEFTRERPLDHHAIIDRQLTKDVFSLIVPPGTTPEGEARLFHALHALLDKVHRNVVAEYIVCELREFPIRIYGRGWGRIKATASPKHEFLSAGEVSECGFQYRSECGILDVAATKDKLHDRTLRAMANGTGFLIASDWSHRGLPGPKDAGLFFDGSPGCLAARARDILRDPVRHRERCADFARRYDEAIPFADFAAHLRSLAASCASSV